MKNTNKHIGFNCGWVGITLWIPTISIAVTANMVNNEWWWLLFVTVPIGGIGSVIGLIGIINCLKKRKEMLSRFFVSGLIMNMLAMLAAVYLLII
jgi:hypothetical protein